VPHSKHLKGHVTYYTITLHFVEFSLITKLKWERIFLVQNCNSNNVINSFLLLLCGINLHKFPFFNFSQVATLTVSTDYLAKSVHVRSRSISISMISSLSGTAHGRPVTFSFY